ncbi:diketogulonate reductase-like aldo/keto reductase [Georgenia soli]|uniref:Diketogulonate reductase-like aldo/keto reductase n=2 Tax=Georgenia soli TaxID=638953 RepID=A0A2A9EQ27_9MICO|nr:diketogulonate reductase-like aldo/keto reductase [Georgenia soli]
MPLMSALGSITLNDGHLLPAIGFGTWRVTGDEATDEVRSALEAGYRLIDTAASYGNEEEVGRAVTGSGVPREEIVVTSKLRGADQGYDAALRGFERTLGALGLDRLDLYLIHWPLPARDLYVESWKALVRLREEGAVRSVGVSNFTAAHLDRLIDETGVTPAVNQIELHPGLVQEEMRAANAARGIVTESWGPLGRGKGLLDTPAVREVAAAHGVSPARAVLRWHHQLGVVPLPKSADPLRQRENLDIAGFTLSDEEMARLGSLPQRRLGGDPDTHEE